MQISLVLVWLCCAIASDRDYDPEQQIVDDYNEPIPLSAKVDENDDDEEEETPDSQIETDSDHRDSENDTETGPTDEDEEEEVPDKENAQPANSYDHGEEHADRLHHESPIESGEPKMEPSPKGPDYRSLLVKVYRGPTKQINEKPFASWGYFVKYPSEDSDNNNKAIQG